MSLVNHWDRALSFTKHQFPEQLPGPGTTLGTAHSGKGKAGTTSLLREFLNAGVKTGDKQIVSSAMVFKLGKMLPRHECRMKCELSFYNEFT